MLVLFTRRNLMIPADSDVRLDWVLVTESFGHPSITPPKDFASISTEPGLPDLSRCLVFPARPGVRLNAHMEGASLCASVSLCISSARSGPSSPQLDHDAALSVASAPLRKPLSVMLETDQIEGPKGKSVMFNSKSPPGSFMDSLQASFGPAISKTASHLPGTSRIDGAIIGVDLRVEAVDLGVRVLRNPAAAPRILSIRLDKTKERHGDEEWVQVRSGKAKTSAQKDRLGIPPLSSKICARRLEVNPEDEALKLPHAPDPMNLSKDPLNR
ncbi:hypothetical protein NL676_000910 [Syzygium grande]|nr:hypothetical protein NL676_000910 [Syzygium grande]